MPWQRNPSSEATDSDDNHSNVENERDAAVDLYAEFNLTRDATEVQIKKSYRLLCLKYHPDKLANATEAERVTATQKFQQVAQWYQILSDPRKRERYDRTGIAEDREFEFAEKGDMSWTEFFQNLWSGFVTEERIVEYEKEYKGTETEKEDILAAVTKTKGDILDALEYILFSNLEELDRYRTIVQAAIDADEIPIKRILQDPRKFRRYQKRAAAEAKEVEQLRESIKASLTEGAVALKTDTLADKHKRQFANMIAGLEEKYVSKPAGKGKKAKAAPGPPELSDADFEAFQKKMLAKSSKNSRQSESQQEEVPAKNSKRGKTATSSNSATRSSKRLKRE